MNEANRQRTLAATRSRRASLPLRGELELLEARQLLTSAPIGGSILFVDHDVLDAGSLRSLPGTEVVFLDARRDGISQVSEALAGRRGLDSIGFVSHGTAGEFGLGATRLDALTLHDLAGAVAGWGDSLSENGDIALWGCDVASDAAGRAFVRDLASITRADVAASINSTGNRFAGSDWVLEYRVGEVSAPSLATPFKPTYRYTLGTPNSAPMISGTTPFQGVPDSDTISPFTDAVIADADNDTLAISVTLDDEAKGVFTPASLTASGFVSVGGGMYTFAGTPSAATAALVQLVFDPTDNRVTPGGTELTTFTIEADDGAAAPVSDSNTSVFSVSINDAPVIGGVSALIAVADTGTARPFPNVTFADADNPAQTLSVSVSLDDAAKGVFTPASLATSGFADAGGGVYTFSGTASAAQTAIRQLYFDPTNNRVAPGMTEVTTFTISVDDGVAPAVTNNQTRVYSVSVNDAPTIGGASAGQAVNDNSTLTPFSAVTIGDVDNPAQTLSVSVTLDSSAKGVFTSASLMASGFTDAGGGLYTRTGTAATVQAAIRMLAFDPTNNRVAVGMTETTTFTISVSDGLASPQANNTTTVVSTSINDAPTIGGTTAGQMVNETATVMPFSAATIAEVDVGQTVDVSVTLDDSNKGVFTAASLMASGFSDMGGGVYTLAGVTGAAAQTAIRQLVFDPADNRVDTGMTETTTFTISVDDGVAVAVTDNTTTVVSTAVNEAPTIGGVSAGQAVNDNATVSPLSAVTIADPDTPGDTLSVSVTLDDSSKGVFTAASLMASGFADMGGGVYTFSGSAAAAQAAIRQLVFDPADNRVDPGMTETTTFSISVDDGVASPATNNTTTVVSTSINDAPSIGGASAGQAVNDNATVMPFSAVTISDADSTQMLLVTVDLDDENKGVFTAASLMASGFTDNGGGTYSLAGTASALQAAIRQLVFNPADNRVAVGMTETTTFTIAVTDFEASPASDNTTTVVSTSINDAPMIGGVTSGHTVDDNDTLLPFSAVTIVDGDPTQTVDVSVSLDTAAKGVFTAASLMASGFTDMGGGVYTLTGVAASAAQAAVRQLVFDPANDRVAPGMTETTTFTISVDDGVAMPVTDNTTTVVSLSINDAPVIGATSAGQAVNDNATITPFSSVTISDPDSPAQTQTVTVALDSAANGVFTAASLMASGFADMGGGVYTFSGTAAASQAAIRLLAFDPANDRVAVGMTETTTFTITVNDGVGSDVTDTTTTVISTSINDAPVIGGASAGQMVNDTSTVLPFSAVTIADTDPGQSIDISVSLDTAAKGVFTAASLMVSGFADMGGGVYTLSGVSAAAAQAAIRLLAFDPADNRVAPGMTETTTFTISVDDGVAAPVTDNTTTVISTSVNDAPSIGGTSAGQPVNDNATVAPFAAVTIADVDTGQTLTVTVTLDTAAKGVFTAASLMASGFSDDGGGVYSFTGSASASQAAIRQLVFDPADNRVNPGMTETTTFTISVDDGVATAVTDNTTTVVSTSVNDAPSIGGTSAGQAVNDNATLTPFSSVTIADADSMQTLTVTVTLDAAAKGVFTSASLMASGFSDDGGGAYSFMGAASAAQAAIRLLAFDPANDRVAIGMTETTTFTISVDDGVATAVTDNTTTVVSTSVNDAPAIGGASAGQMVNDADTIMPFATITIADPDNPSQTQTVSITLDTAAKGVFTSASLMAAGFSDMGGGVYTFSGSAASAQSGMRQLVFDPTDNRVNLGLTETTTFTISVDDGVAAPATDNTTTVISTNVNDLPTIGATSAGQAVNDNATVMPFASVTIADPDAPAQTQTVTVTLDSAAKGVFTAASLMASGFSDDGGGVYSFSGTAAAAQSAIRQLVFDPTNDRVAVGMTETTTFTITVNDGAGSDVADSTTTVVSTSINDAPTIGGTSAGQGVNENATITPFASVTIADTDPSQSVIVSVTLDVASKGVFTAASLMASGFTDDGGGVYSFTGAAAQAQAAIRLLAFDPADDRVDTGMTETTTFTISVDDGVAAPVTDNTTTVISTAVNTAPTIGGTSAAQAVNDNATVTPFAMVTIADSDTPAQTLDITVSIDDAMKGAFTSASLMASGFADAGGGMYTFTGTAAAAQAAIRQLVFQPAQNRVAVGMTEASTFTLTADDGVASAASDNSTTVISTSVNDAPTLGGAVAAQAVNDNATVAPFASFTIDDVDPSQNVSVTIVLDNSANGVFTPASLAASGFMTSVAGVYTLSGVLPAAAQAAIRQLVFDPANDRVAVGMTQTTAFAVVVSDGLAMAFENTTTVVSTSINDAPVITGAVASQPVNDNATIMPFAGVTITDPDTAQVQTITITINDPALGTFSTESLMAAGFTDMGGGVFQAMDSGSSSTFTGQQMLVFVPTPNRVAVGMTETAMFSISVSDGVAMDVTDTTTSVVITSVNTAPTIGGTTSGQAVNDTGTTMPFSAVTIDDADPSQTVTVTVTLDTAAKGVFTEASLSASGFMSAGGGVYTLSNVSPAAAQSAIRQLVFNPSDNRVNPGSTEATTFTVAVNDGTANTSNSATTVISTSVNDAPTLGGAVAGQTTSDIAFLTPFATFIIADADAAQTVNVSVSLDSAAKGVFTPASLSASGFVSAGGGVYTFAGTASAAQAAIRQLIFNPSNFRLAPGMAETTTFTVSVNDSVASPVTSDTTTVVSISTNAAPTLTAISILTGSVARTAHTISYTTLFAASNAQDLNPSQTIRFRIEDVLNGVVTKDGEPIVEGVTTIGPGENIVWTSDGAASGATNVFTVRAHDGTVASSSPVTVRVSVTPIDPNTAAQDAPVSASSSASGTVSIVTRNDAGDTILLQQSAPGSDWTRINLTAAGVPQVTGGTAAFVDPATGIAHAVVVTASGLFLLSDDGAGNWTSRNLTTELNGPAIVGELSSLTTTDGFNVVGGRTAGGDLVIYHQTGGSNWTSVNLYDLLRDQSEPTPTFTSPIITYVTSWNGLNFGGLDSSGNIWTVWTGGGLNAWHATNLSAITGAPTLVGGVTAYTTPWGGINLAGIDVNGDLTVTWWVPQFGGNWVQSNFSEQFGGPALRPGSVASYVTNWNALNIAGVTEQGEIVQYWWVPPSSPDQDFWRVTPLTTDFDAALRRPSAGMLSGFATQDSRLNLIGSSEDGHIVRLWWSPTTDWALEDITNLT